MRFILSLLLCCALTAVTEAQVSFYQFNPDQDRLGGAVDFSFLNRPLTAADRLFVRDGKFYRVGSDLKANTADDERVRLFGVNLAFGANFPDAADAARIAKRLRRLGVNLVRLHHMESFAGWANPNDALSIVTSGPYPTINTVATARLRAFLDALKAEGIYCNLNLHVGYEFRPAIDNVPALPNGQAMPSQSKPLHIFYPRMVELQKQFTRSVIDALQLSNDPVLAVVEINNESSLIYEWQVNHLDATVRGDYRAELQRQWNTYLSAKYQNTAALQAAWGGETSDGPELLSPSGQPSGNLTGWVLELHGAAQATFDYVAGAAVPTARVNVIDGSNWVIFRQIGFNIPLTDRPFVAECEIRADLPDGQSRNASMTVMRHAPPWDSQFGKSIQVTNQWQKVSVSFIPKAEYLGTGRFSFNLEGLAGTSVYIRNWSLRQAAQRGLAPGETLEAGNVSLVSEGETATQARMDDYLRFLVDRDRNYLREMLAAVREKVGPLTPVTGTQMSYGGLVNLDSHAEMDYQDNHYYVDHYGFPNVAWDSKDWYIRDLSHVGGGLWALKNMAITREGNQPYTVSEFNQPWPNTYAAEHDPVTAAFAAFQDWDGLMHFAYAHDRNWSSGPNGFNINGDWTKLPNVGQSAWLFRSGAIDEGREVLEIPLSDAVRLRAAREKRNWSLTEFIASVLGYQPDNAFVHPVRIVKDDVRQVPAAAKQAPSNPYLADTGELTYDRNGKVFLIHALRAAGVIGFAGGRKVTAGAIDLELAASSRGFASVLVNSLDEQPIQNSSRLLLTTPGYALRTQPGSSPARPQQLVKYSSSNDWWTLEREPTNSKPSGDLSNGQSPYWMERIESYVTLRTTARQLTVYPLDGAGMRLAPLPAQDVQKVDGGFRIHLQADGQQFAPWYEIAAEPSATATSVVAANYAPERLAADSIATAFGTNLATAFVAATPNQSLPTDLAGTTVKIKDSTGAERLASLFFVSPTQVNYYLPADVAPGPATVTITSGDGSISTGTIQITPVAPGIFTADATGSGLAAALVQRVKADGSQFYERVAEYDAAQKKFVAVPIDVSKTSEQVYLLLFGTGIRRHAGTSAVSARVGDLTLPVAYAGAQGQFIGLDQINILLPASLAGRGEIGVTLVVNGKAANIVKMNVK